MQAVILAAGLGKRLGKLTEHSTKFMVPINGQPLARHSLDILAAAGITRFVIVIGHGGEELRNFIGPSYRGIPVEYVESSLYREINNIYSLFLARQHLEADDSLLLESDLIYDPQIIADCLSSSFANLAVVAKHEPWMDGTVVLVDDGKVAKFISKDEFVQADRDRYFKTVNIYKLSRDFCLNRFMPFLQTYIQLHGSNNYYEDVLKVLVYMGADLGALPIAHDWYEIDDMADLDVASALFATPGERAAGMHSRFGGYWRFKKLVDFCYLVNPYFPPKRLLDELAASLPHLVIQYPSGMKVHQAIAGGMFGCAPDHIVVGNGAAELIRALIAELPGRIGVPVPTFDEYTNSIEPERLVILQTSAPDFSVNVADLVRFSDEQKLAALVLVNPANPSGQCLSRKDILALCEGLETVGTRLVLDESFVDFIDGTDAHGLTRDDILEAHPKLITIKSISKSYGVPGLRLGVMAAAERLLIERVAKRLAIWNINSLAEWFMQIVGRYRASYWNACRQLVATRNNLLEGLRKITYLRALPSATNYVLCQLHDGASASDLEQWLLSERWILIKNCSDKRGFSAGQWVRLAVRDEADNNRLLHALADFGEVRQLSGGAHGELEKSQ